ncbi:transmembrane receptor protein tyrosine kinase, partial [Branchiostoma belcheri]
MALKLPKLHDTRNEYIRAVADVTLVNERPLVDTAEAQTFLKCVTNSGDSVRFTAERSWVIPESAVTSTIDVRMERPAKCDKALFRRNRWKCDSGPESWPGGMLTFSPAGGADRTGVFTCSGTDSSGQTASVSTAKTLSS